MQQKKNECNHIKNSHLNCFTVSVKGGVFAVLCLHGYQRAYLSYCLMPRLFTSASWRATQFSVGYFLLAKYHFHFQLSFHVSFLPSVVFYKGPAQAVTALFSQPFFLIPVTVTKRCDCPHINHKQVKNSTNSTGASASELWNCSKRFGKINSIRMMRIGKYRPANTRRIISSRDSSSQKISSSPCI